MNRFKTVAASSAIVTAFLFVGSIAAQTTQQAQQVKHAEELGRPVARIVAPVDSAARTTIVNSVHPAVSRSTDLGRVRSGTPTGPMRLMLKATPEQEHDLQTLVDLQGDSTSGSFHKWLTPNEFGTRFGASDADIAKLTAWLSAQGFSVDHVARGKRAITFHGTSAQLESAFKTEMHRVSFNGHEHVANTRSVSIPTAFAGVVAGVSRLDDFFPRQPHTPAGRATRGSDGKWHSDFTSGGGSYYMSPGDFSTIYNTRPLLDAGNDGTGITIGIVAWSEIPISDVETFRSLFGLKKNDPSQIILGADQGIYPAGEGEAELDVEWSGAAAPGARILFPVAQNTFTSDFLGSSLEYLVDSNQPDVISASVAECETYTQAFLVPYYEQAAAQGITVFASASDSGSDGCDDFDTATAGTTGYGVNGWSSTPYNTSVGGTMFDDSDGSLYWNATNDSTYSSAKGYIPEMVWNESGASENMDLRGIWAGSGGVSSLFARPAWQTGPGIPAQDPIAVTSSVPGPHRSIPDVSLTAAIHDGYLTCFDDGGCQGNAGGSFGGADVSGGTSASSPSYAGIEALIDQKYGRQGVANYTLYQLAAKQNAANCNSSDIPAASCVFNDVTKGNNAVPCEGGTTDCPDTTEGTTGVYAEFPAGTAYDFATGLGSVNAANLSAQWGTVAFRSTQTLLKVAPAAAAHGAAVTLTAYVEPGSGSGAPTGDVSFYTVASSGSTKGYGFATLSGDAATQQLDTLPAGTYQVVARYGGDDTFGASYSNPITVTVGSESSTTTVQPAGVDGDGNYNLGQTAYSYGDPIYVNATVAGKSGNGAPTGNVTLSEGGTAIATQALTPAEDSPLADAAGSDTLFTLSPVPGVTVGSHTYVAKYAGDASFASSVSSGVTLKVGKGTPAPVITGNFDGAGIAKNQQVVLTAVVPALGPAAPTGTVQFYNGTAALGASVALTAGNGQSTAMYTFAPTAGVTANITVRYSGDANYLVATSADFSFTVEGGSQATTTVLGPLSSGAYGNATTLTATVKASVSTTSVNGTVDFYSGGIFVGSAGLSGTTATLTVVIPGGTHSITASYRGSPTYSGSSSSAVSETITRNAPAVTITASPLSVAVGQPFSLTGYVPAAGSGSAPSGTISFYSGTTLLGTSPILGESVYGNSYARLTYIGATAGTFSLTAKYNGDGNYSTETSAAQSVTVRPVNATDTTFTVSPYPPTRGQPGTIQIRVARSNETGTPTGTVTVYANGSAVASASLTAGAVTIPVATAGLPAGKYLLYVAYSGDASDQASTSLEQTIELRATAPTTISLAFSPANAAAGSTVTATATVSEANAAVVPTGTVSFYYGGNFLASSPLANGVATAAHSTQGLSAGPYVITAKYGGDALNTAASTAATLTLH